MADADFRLDGRTAAVTGASRGIGRATALELAASGADLYIHGRDPAALQETAEEIRAMGRRCETASVDFSAEDAAAELVDRWWRERPLDIWINNAGADVLTGAKAELDFESKLELLWRIDVRATVSGGRAAGWRMRERGRGVIVNVAWDQCSFGMAGDSGEMFAATKGAVAAFTLSLARSLAPAVRVNAVAPGWIRTAWGESAPAAWQQRAVAEALVGRWGEPGDVARAIRFLASDAASFVNGQIVAVNGGFAGPAARPASP